MLNSNEILHLGGSYDYKTHSVVPVQKYNIQTRTLTNLKSEMIYPRTYYGAVKYDNSHVLLFGGICKSPILKQSSCSKISEIYDINSNKFTSISSTNYEYVFMPKSLLLSDGRVLIFENGHVEVFNPKTRAFTKIPNKKGLNSVTFSQIENCLIELNPNEVLVCDYGWSSERTIEILDLKLKTSSPIQTPPKDTYKYNLGTPVKISSGEVLFIGAGETYKDILKLDIKTRELTKTGKLPKALVGDAVLLENNEILFLSGELRPEIVSLIWYSPGKSLVHSVYDYKKNKIYKRRTASYFTWWTNGIFPVENAVYIIDYKSDKLRKYSYKVKKENNK